MDDTVTHLGPWECFQDRSYYDMWCVRQVHDREFGHGFHLVNGEEAARLRDFLNTRIAHQPDIALADELRALANAEAEYRRSHDLFGTDDMRTGRAWDAMRRAGDKARAILTALGGHHEPS